ncbi:hypothetical protein AB0K80_10615 [Streptomyces sp. NPDC052682]|uniref:hypothetical protein n=1 Tax=Streptomyces sp. NPDC052682 TaxID=3154954 RepID=UPI00342BEA0E
MPFPAFHPAFAGGVRDLTGRPLTSLECVTSAEQPEQHPYRRLTWDEADPDRHPFLWDADEAAQVTSVIEQWVPGPADDDDPWWPRWRFTKQVTAFYVERYGRWAQDWDWSAGEGGAGGGVVGSWCCPSHSVTTPDETAARAVAALLEWRGWLEELAEKFQRLAPDRDAAPDERSWHLERAAVRLVTLVVDRTGAESGWYGLCTLVLEWFLTSHGLDSAAARAAVADAVGGRFASWTRPGQRLVDSVGEDLATGVTGCPPYREPPEEHTAFEEWHERRR